MGIQGVEGGEIRGQAGVEQLKHLLGALQVFDVVWAMTSRAETDATRVLNLYIFREFKQSRLGYAAAIGVVIFSLTLIVTWGQLRLLRGRT